MASQFLHISLYGRKRRPGAARHETAIGMLNEAARVISATGHLSAPMPPRHLFGEPPLAIARDVRQLVKIAKDRGGRRLRSDAHLLMCAVASFPVPRHEVMRAGQEYALWLELVMAWLKTQFGSHLAGVVEHEDEAHLHIHAFILPPVASDGQIQWNSVHPGRQSKKIAAEAGASARGQDEAYIAAMEVFQDGFHQAVSSRFDHARFATRRERRPRAQHLRIRDLEAENALLKARVVDVERHMASRFDPAGGPSTNALFSAASFEVRQDLGDQDDDLYQAENAADAVTFRPGELNEEDDGGPDTPNFDEDAIGDDWNTEPGFDLDNNIAEEPEDGRT